MSNSCKFKLRSGPLEEIHEQFLLLSFCQIQGSCMPVTLRIYS